MGRSYKENITICEEKKLCSDMGRCSEAGPNDTNQEPSVGELVTMQTDQRLRCTHLNTFILHYKYHYQPLFVTLFPIFRT